MDVRCRIELFGELRVLQGDRIHTRFRTHKAANLLAYLALHLQKAHAREHLVDLFWPDMEIEAGRDNLSTALSQLRRQLEPTGTPSGSVLVANRQILRLNPEAVSADVADFDHLIRQAKQMESAPEKVTLLLQAIELYRGDLLPGCYEDWATLEQNRCQSLYLESLRQLARLLEETGRYAEALETEQRVIAADPYSEEGYRAQIRLLVRMKRPSAALQVYEELEQRLKRELGVRPSAPTRQMAETLRQDPRAALLMQKEAAADARPPVAPARETAETPAAHELSGPAAPTLPLQLTRFFGREQEREQIAQWLQTPGTRLVTILGPGGAGKTRLSIEVAAQVTPAFANRVWFVPLADIPDVGLISSALVNALRLPPSAKSNPLDRVIEHLGNTPCLLVLDNMEHLLREPPEPGKSDNPALSGGVALIRILLERMPGLVCLLTSRQPSRLSGEQEYPLPPLAPPNEDDSASPEMLMRNPSIALYVDRARASRPDFALTAQNASAVIALCRRLEGMPLAIEMAAAWVKTIPPHKMLERLEHQLALLVSRRRDLPPRHQSLRATIEWSYDLLSTDLRQVFASLSVFRGGWTVEAAEAVCGEDALHALVRLQEQSLIVAFEDVGETRYRMLEPLREFAHEKIKINELSGSVERQQITLRHAAYFADLAYKAHLAYHAPDEKVWMDRLAADHDNLRTVLQSGLTEGGNTANTAKMVTFLCWFWLMRGHGAEGCRWSRQAMSRCDAEEIAISSELFNGAGILAHEQGDYVEARNLLQKATATAQKANNLRKVLMARNNLAIAAYDLGDIDLARLSWEENLALARNEGWDKAIATALSNLGELAYDEGDFARASSMLEESCLIRQRLGDLRFMARTLGLLGKVAHRQHDLPRAELLMRDCLGMQREIENRLGVIETLEAMAALAVTSRHPKQATRLLAFAGKTRLEIGIPRPPNESKECEVCLDKIRTVLNESTFDAAWKQGEQWTLEQACACAPTEAELEDTAS